MTCAGSIASSKRPALILIALSAALILAAGCGRKPEKRIDPPRMDIVKTKLVAPTELKAFDTPNDAGKSVTLTWKASKTENTPQFLIEEEIERQPWITELTPKDIKENKSTEKKTAENQLALKRSYDKEPAITYEVYMRKQFCGIMKFLAGIYQNDFSETEKEWKNILDAWKKADKAGKSALVGEIVRLSGVMRTGDKVEQELAVKISKFIEALAPFEKADGDLKGLEEFAAVLKDLMRFIEKKDLEQLTKKLEKPFSHMRSEDVREHPKKIAAILTQAEFTQMEIREFVEDASSKEAKEARKKRIEELKKEVGELDARISSCSDNILKAVEDLLKNDTARKELLVIIQSNSPWTLAGSFPSGGNYLIDKPGMFGHSKSGEQHHYFIAKGLADGFEYRFRVELVMGEKKVPVLVKLPDKELSEGVVVARAKPNWFNSEKTGILIVMLVFGAVVLVSIAVARKNPNMFIRKIGGLDAVDEAIGRATEMGKPIFFMTGLKPMSELPTIAAINILGRIARRAAKYDTEIKVPCYDPVVMTVAQEVVKEAYQAEGRLDVYKEENVFFVTQDQFSYVASVDGMMMREKPATNFLMGYFYAESLLLSEAGAGIGAIQVAGTDALAQLPFFITTTDYTLIGEELYAASAYLSRDPLLLGSLKGQDIGKAALIVVIVLGTLLSTIGVAFITRFFS
jgi:hypothetical protein